MMERGAVFAHRLEAVLPADSLDDICRLLLHVTRRGVHPCSGVKTAFCGSRAARTSVPVRVCYLFASVKIVPGVYAPVVQSDPDRHYDMQMVASMSSCLK